MSKGRLIAVFAILLGVAAFAGMAVYGLNNDPRELPSALINKPFPEFELNNLLAEGQTISKRDLLGKPALVNVWATWCPTCRQEHDDLNKLAKQGVTIFGVNYKDDSTKAQKWLTELLNPYALNISDPKGTLGFDLGVYGAPETFLLDKQGVIRLKHVGEVNDRVWREKIGPKYEELLNQ